MGHELAITERKLMTSLLKPTGRTLLTTLAVVALLALGTVPALAASPHYVCGPTSTPTATSVTTTGCIAGLGNEDVTLTQSIDVAVTCHNPGKNSDVPGQRKSFSSSEVALHPDNGRLNFSITTSVGDLTGACPNDQWVPSGTVTGYSLAVYQGGVQVL
jgi:hypothetical protein